MFAATAYAGNAIQTTVEGLPISWGKPGSLSYQVDPGALKSAGSYDAAESLQLVEDAFSTWTDAPEIALQAGFDGFLPFDIDGSNFSSFYPGDREACYPEIFGASDAPCLTPIIFDEDGEIVDEIFGDCAKFSVLGFAGFETLEESTEPRVRKGSAIFSGACLDPMPKDEGCGTCKRTLSDAELRSVVMHELGHLLGMDHSQLNPEALPICRESKEGCPAQLQQVFPLMFPILVDGGASNQLHADDLAYFQRLYGKSRPGCQISGRVLAQDGKTEIRGLEVVAKNVDPTVELRDAYGFVSGAEAPRASFSGKGQDNCLSNCGDFLLTGLKPDSSYRVCVQSVLAEFEDSSSVGPVNPPFAGGEKFCPEDGVFQCVCQSGDQDCSSKKLDIVTPIDPKQVKLREQAPPPSGGCSLMRENS